MDSSICWLTIEMFRTGCLGRPAPHIPEETLSPGGNQQTCLPSSSTVSISVVRCRVVLGCVVWGLVVRPMLVDGGEGRCDLESKRSDRSGGVTRRHAYVSGKVVASLAT